jgi:hypothetical protein
MILIVSLFLVSSWIWLMMVYRMGCSLSGLDGGWKTGGRVEGDREAVGDGPYE